MNAPARSTFVVGALLLAIGVTAGGYFAGAGFLRARTGDRTVLVRGVSEREAKADLAIWPLRLVVTDEDLVRANARAPEKSRPSVVVVAMTSSVAGLSS